MVALLLRFRIIESSRLEETFKTVKSNHLELEVQVVTWFSFAPQRAQAHIFYLMDAASDVRLVPTEV